MDTSALYRTHQHQWIRPGRKVGQPGRLLFNTSFDASWEIDLLGSGRATRGAAEATIALAGLDLEDARLSIVSEVTRTYVTYRSFEAQAAILEDIVERQEQLVKAVLKRRHAGEASDIDLLQCQNRFAEFEARRPAIDAALKAQLVSIAILTGSPPAEQQIGPAPDPSSLIAFKILPQPVGSDTLLNRPDVRRAERTYILAARRKDIAAIELYPSIILIASARPNATDVSDLLDPTSLAANFAGLVGWTLLDAGKRQSPQSAASERTVQAELAYRRSVLTAADDVEIALARLAQANSELALQSSLAEQKQALAEMAAARLAGGTGTLLEAPRRAGRWQTSTEGPRPSHRGAEVWTGTGESIGSILMA